MWRADVHERRNAPETIKRVEPDLSSCKGTHSGNAVVEAKIGVDGKPHEIRLVRSEADCIDTATLEAFQQWRFCPAEREGRPFETVMQFTVNIHYR